MCQLTSWRPTRAALAVALCAVVASGCASWRGPRIDPTGEQFFIWPGEPVPSTVVGPPVAGPPILGPAVAPPQAVAPPSGNVVAPPVYSDGGLSVAPPTFPAQASATTAPLTTSVPALPGAIIVGRDHLQLSPQQVIAPVGTEVVLKAGVCTAGSYLLANQRVEWLLAREGVGQIVDLNGRGEFDVFSWPWDTPRKIDNWYAIGAAANFPVRLDRGTPDPNDDIPIQRGEAWISVTSPAEGTSYVTAYAPEVADWQLRQAIATIHWIDAQWLFPPSAVAEAGRPHVLATSVARRSDGAPIPGWIVRYEASGSGSLGYAGESVVEVPTDATGRASVEVSPLDSGGGTATVNMVLVRPPQVLPTASPQLDVARGVAAITWAGSSVSPMPTPAMPSPPAAPEPPSPRDSVPGGTYSPPPDQPPPGKPRLQVEIRRTSPEPARVGDFARFEVTVTNDGNGTARAIVATDRFDRQLSHPEAKPGTFQVEYRGMRDLAPGQSATIPLTFEVMDAGRPCHEVTVSCDGGDAVTASACISTVAPPPVVQPTLEVTKQGPVRHFLNEVAKFKTIIKNTGSVAVTNLQVVEQYDRELEVRVPLRDSSCEILDDGRLRWRIDRLDPDERREFSVDCTCVAAADSTCSRVVVTGEGVNYAAEKCLEISPVGPIGPGGDSASTAGAKVTLSIVESSVSTRIGERVTIFVRAENVGTQPARIVGVRVLVPQEMSPVAADILPKDGFEIVGLREIRFSPLAEMAPGQRREFVVTATADRSGVVTILGQIAAEGMAAPVEAQSKPIEILAEKIVD